MGRVFESAHHRLGVAGGAKNRHLNDELVTKYSRVAEKGPPSIEGMDVRAADADAVNAHQRFVGLDRCRGLFCGEQGQAAGFFKADRFHIKPKQIGLASPYC
jgi:hypothetical protein